VAVGGNDLLSGTNLVESIALDEFVARGQDRHARRADDLHFREAERGEHADLRGANRRARGDGHATLDDVLAPRSHVLPRVARVANLHADGAAVGVLLPY